MSVVESVILRRPELIERFLEQFPGIDVPVEKPRSIVVAGIGSSAAGGIFLQDFSPYPVFVSRDVTLPRFVSEEDLVIVSSFSGNTGETLLALRDALNRNIKPIVITSGGKLLEVAKSLKLPIIELEPKGYTSRSLVALIIVATMAAVSKLIPGIMSLLRKVPNVITKAIDDEENIKEISLRIGGRVVVSVGYGPFKAAMKRITAEFEENSKLPAFYVEIPEANHNYLVAAEHPGIIHVYPEHERRESLMPLASRLNPKQHVPIRVSHRDMLGNFEIITKAALASIRLARLLGRDPDDISKIEELKKRFLKDVESVFKRI